ncbi:hypothetical protein A2U01_0117401 [Trifolium medium]|uniref:Uncharacterized protein n=1 Tax=Trifolium medium TaxID=97028 RepID=A0A392W8N3_9FABA|nr:hypothetical protein [Trifolium medium]
MAESFGFLASTGESRRARRHLSLKPRSATTQEHARSLPLVEASLSDQARTSIASMAV